MKNNTSVELTYSDKSFKVEGVQDGKVVKIDRNTATDILLKIKLPHLVVPSEALIVQDKHITVYPQFIHIEGYGMLDKKRYYVLVTDSTEVVIFKIIK